MATDAPDRQLVWIVLVLGGAVVVLPALVMGVGLMTMGPTMGGMTDHGMWGGPDGSAGWMVLVWAVLQLLFLAIVVGVGYLGYRALRPADGSPDRAMEELRAAYARGDLDDEEFERRRDRLESDR